MFPVPVDDFFETYVEELGARGSGLPPDAAPLAGTPLTSGNAPRLTPPSSVHGHWNPKDASHQGPLLLKQEALIAVIESPAARHPLFETVIRTRCLI
jgi:hypothetical protein